LAERRFKDLRQELLRAGVAPRSARRAALEIESHFQQLTDEEIGRGASENDARIEAHRRLGANQELVLRYAARPELRAWSRRWPSLCFMIVPLLTYLAVAFATLVGMVSIVHRMGSYLHRIQVAPDVTREIDLAVRVVLLWCLPLCVAAAFTLLAGRRRVALRWPVMGIILVSALASLCTLVVTVKGGAELGEIRAGIGISPESLSEQSMHAALLVALSLVPLWTLRRAQRDRGLN
jgi:hypothetical protein